MMTKIKDKITIRDKDIKIRKDYAPPIKAHSLKKEYKRKPKTNWKDLWEEAEEDDLV